MLILNSLTLSPSSLQRECISVALSENSRTAWNFRFKYWACQKHFLRNILISSNLKSEVFVPYLFIYLFVYLFIYLVFCFILHIINYFSFNN